MTSGQLYEVLRDIHEKHVQKAKKSGTVKRAVWLKRATAAACLCFAALGIFAMLYSGEPPDAAIAQPETSNLAVNEAETLEQLDMDVQISHYTDFSAEEWNTVLKAFEQSVGMRYEEFTSKLPPSCRQTAFYSIDAPTSPKSGVYVPHDYVFEFLTEQGGSVNIAICAGEAPLRDCFFLWETPKESNINGTTACIYAIQDQFMVQFSYGAVNYDMETRKVPLEELETLLTGITRES